MENEKLKYIPVMFQKVQEFTNENIDTRFLKVKIWLMHLGENLNGSYFNKDVVEQAIPTLKNTPILCFIEENSEGEKDFSDHRMVLVREDGEFKFKYLGSAIGVIPETNNAHFEFRVCDDGIEREFLVVDGLVWTKWDDPIDIFNKNMIKSQSMELHENYEGKFEKDNLFHFTSFSFFGACVLGDSVSPAMQNSTVEIQQFSTNSIFDEINTKFELYKNNFTKGGSKVKREEILAKFSQLSGEEFENILNNNEISDEELENQLFALSVNQIRQAINTQLEGIKGYYEVWNGEIEEISKYWLADIIPSENMAIVEDNVQWNVFYAIPYSMNGDVAVLDEENKKRYVRGDWREMVGGDNSPVNPMYSQIKEIYQTKVNEKLSAKEEEIKNTFNAKETEEYKALEVDFNEKVKEITSLNEAVEKYTKDINELTEFKNKQIEEKRKSDVDLVIAKFELEEDEVKELKTQAYEGNLELDVFEEKLFALVGKKNFTLESFKNESKDVSKFSLKKENKCPYEGLEHFFTKE